MHIRNLLALFGLLAALVSVRVQAKPPAAPSTPSTALAEYVAQADDSFAWTKRREGKLGAGTYAELILTSQTWRDIPWKHQLFIYRPSRIAPGSQALLLIAGGAWRESYEQAPVAGQNDKLPGEAHVLAGIAEALQAPVAVLMQVPQQPIFDGKVEDEIISYTFAKYFETGDEQWPLLLPMVKSAVRGMDAVQQFAKQEWKLDIEHFLVTGASKRGWTTWLTAAVDPRVNALAPMVINMLNMRPHMKLQAESFGGYSEQISEYTDKGLNEKLDTQEGAALRAIVDPYSYREKLKQPKLILLGTNDRYWPVDSLNLYWDGLKGDKYIVYAPNEGHGLEDYPRVLGAVAALFRSTVEGKPLPKLDWKFEVEGDHLRLSVTSDEKPVSMNAWTAKADSRDFRESLWTSRPAKPNGNGGRSFVVDLPKPKEGFAAVYAEAKYNGQSMPYYLSTDLRVVPASEPAAGADAN